MDLAVGLDMQTYLERKRLFQSKVELMKGTLCMLLTELNKLTCSNCNKQQVQIKNIKRCRIGHIMPCFDLTAVCACNITWHQHMHQIGIKNILEEV